jgi:hypothetical protein
MDIVKSTGEKQPFSKEKFCTSLQKAGAPATLANNICSQIEERIRPGVSTKKIYREALRYLVKNHIDVAARYSLHKGVATMGPAGFIFEKYIEIILQAYGYSTQRNLIMQGACISHEVDIIASKDSVHFLLEAKYHNELGIKTHVPTVMYADARLEDIRKAEEKRESGKFKHKMWLITNTKFTDTAIKYAQCKNLRLTGWNYPQDENLENIIVSRKLYPVTTLPSVTRKLLERFAEKNIILAQDLATYSIKDLMRFGISEPLAYRISNEVKGLFKNI